MRPGARLLLTSGVAAWQNPGEIEGFVEGSTNAYVPLVDTTVVNHVSWVAPQLYNDLIPFGEDPVKYVTSLQAGHTIEWDGKTIEVKVPSNKIVLGHPATRGAAPAGAKGATPVATKGATPAGGGAPRSGGQRRGRV